MAKRARKTTKRPAASPRKRPLAKSKPAKAAAKTRKPKPAAKPKSGIADLQRELMLAHDRQAATSEILRIISKSPADVQPVLDAIAESAKRLLDGLGGLVTRVVGDELHAVAITAGSPEVTKAILGLYPTPVSGSNAHSRAAASGRAIIRNDIPNDPRASPAAKAAAAAMGFRSVIVVPMLREGTAIGTIGVPRAKAGEFSSHHIQLLQTFADQAVIAIENVRLFNETQEALERQTATADVLEVINSSQGNLTPVFDAILRKAHALCGVASGSLEIYDGERFFAVAAHGMSDTFVNMLREGYVAAESPATLPLLAGHRISHIHDTLKVDFPVVRAAAEVEGIRTVLLVPLRKEGRLLGMIAAARHEMKPFSEKEIGLLENFAVQAAIAIENARLFNETREALERQTATADILKVIASSPSDVRPVFDAIVANADRLVGGLSTGVYRYVDGVAYLEAFTPRNPVADEMLRGQFPRPVAGIPHFEMAQAGKVMEIPDTETSDDLRLREIARAREFRSLLSLPMMSMGTTIGVIVVSRTNPSSFSAHHIQLLQTFADQAVIAIENVRLFNETQEALERQTATASVLQVISESMADSAPVFESILDSCEKLFPFTSAGIALMSTAIIRSNFRPLAAPGQGLLWSLFPQPLDSIFGQAISGLQPLYTANVAESERTTDAVRLAAKKVAGYSMLQVPMIWQGRGIGSINVSRLPNVTFSEKEVTLLEDLRRSGGDRDPERAAVQRNAGSAGAADGYG